MPIAVAMGLAMRFGAHSGQGLDRDQRRLASPRCSLRYGADSSSTARAWEAGSRCNGTTLAWWIMGYGLLASVLPVWLLLAPRGLPQHVHENRHGRRLFWRRDRRARARSENAGAHEVHRRHRPGVRRAGVSVLSSSPSLAPRSQVSTALISSRHDAQAARRARTRHPACVGYGAMVTEMLRRHHGAHRRLRDGARANISRST